MKQSACVLSGLLEQILLLSQYKGGSLLISGCFEQSASLGQPVEAYRRNVANKGCGLLDLRMEQGRAQMELELNSQVRISKHIQPGDVLSFDIGFLLAQSFKSVRTKSFEEHVYALELALWI